MDANKVLEIPVWVNGTPKWVTGLTKRTTCDDIIYALLYNDGKQDHDSTDRYTIYERWRDVERPLQARTKILKIWRAWGAEQCNVQLTMKNNNEPDYFGEFLHHRRRRHRRSKHRSRSDRESRSKTENGQVKSTSDRLKTMEHFAKLVINQERKIHEIGYQIEDTDRRIDTMETNLHFSRVAENGEDYLQNNYLDNELEDSMDEFLRKVPSENMDMYMEFCERVLQVDDQIKNETSRIEDLSTQLIDETIDKQRNSRNYVNTSDENLETELTSLQAELNRMVNANVMQKYEAAHINNEIDQCDRSLMAKQETVRQLLKQLEQEDYENVFDDNYENVCNLDSNEQISNKQITPETVRQQQEVRAYPPKKVKFEDEQEAVYVNLDTIMGMRDDYQNDVINSSSDTRDTGKGDSFDLYDSQRKTSDLDDSFSIDTENASNDSQLGCSPPGVRFSSPLVTYSRSFNPDSPLPNYANIKSSSPIGSSYPDVKATPNKSPCLRLPRYPEGSAYRNDDLISERIKTEIYKYKRVYFSDQTSPCGYNNRDIRYTSKTTEDNDSNSDTGLSSMHSDESPSYNHYPSFLETLV